VEGVVEKPDVIGAIFGQTEGLFGSDLDLRELQKSGRVGRIEITLKSEKDKTTGHDNHTFQLG
jgi:DNA primase